MTYYVKSNILHNGSLLSKGEAVELPEEVAHDLIKTGVLSTEPVEKDVSRENITHEEAPKGPTAGGETPKESGEPSLDGTESGVSGSAKDVTPGTETVSATSDVDGENTTGGSATTDVPEVPAQQTGEVANTQSDPSANL